MALTPVGRSSGFIQALMGGCRQRRARRTLWPCPPFLACYVRDCVSSAVPRFNDGEVKSRSVQRPPEPHSQNWDPACTLPTGGLSLQIPLLLWERLVLFPAHPKLPKPPASLLSLAGFPPPLGPPASPALGRAAALGKGADSKGCGCPEVFRQCGPSPSFRWGKLSHRSLAALPSQASSGG